MAQTLATDALAGTFGLMPRYLRERLAAEAEAPAEAATAVPPPAPVVTDLLLAMRRIDAATPDLRRRIAAASQSRFSPLAMAPAFAGASLMLGVLLRT
jgi:hypothetical protein